MKTKLLTLALFGLMSLSFMACSEEEIVPVNENTIEQATADCECDGGISERETPHYRTIDICVHSI
jgi:hypothetical protein